MRNGYVNSQGMLPTLSARVPFHMLDKNAIMQVNTQYWVPVWNLKSYIFTVKEIRLTRAQESRPHLPRTILNRQIDLRKVPNASSLVESGNIATEPLGTAVCFGIQSFKRGTRSRA